MRPLNSPHTIRAVLIGLAVGLSGHLPVLAVSGPPLRTGLWVTQKISEAAADPTAFEATVRAKSTSLRRLSSHWLEGYRERTW